MKHLLSIIFMLSVALGADICKEIDKQTMNQMVGISRDSELADIKMRFTIVDVGCKNNTFIYKMNVETNFYVDNDAISNFIDAMHYLMMGEYCYKYSNIVNIVNMKVILYFNNYANSKSFTLTKRDCQ